MTDFSIYDNFQTEEEVKELFHNDCVQCWDNGINNCTECIKEFSSYVSYRFE